MNLLLKRHPSVKCDISDDGHATLRDDELGCSEKLSPLGAIVWEFCDGTGGVDDIVDQLKQLEVIDEVTPELTQSVKELVHQLMESGLLEDSSTTPKHETETANHAEQAVVPNPYLDEYNDLAWVSELKEKQSPARFRNMVSLHLIDNKIFTRPTGMQESYRSIKDKYAYSIPNQLALDAIARHSPILEIGAGRGYWASLLRQMGTVVVAYDAEPTESGRNDSFRSSRRTFSEVLKGGPERVREHKDHTLLFVWPENNEMAPTALQDYVGDVLLFAGLKGDMRTGGNRFHKMLEEEWTLVNEIPLPTFPGVDDRLFVYKRKD